MTPPEIARLETLIRQIRLYHREFDGDPNGEVDAPKGAQCADISTGDVYRKTSDVGTLTGWVTP